MPPTWHLQSSRHAHDQKCFRLTSSCTLTVTLYTVFISWCCFDANECTYSRVKSAAATKRLTHCFDLLRREHNHPSRGITWTAIAKHWTRTEINIRRLHISDLLDRGCKQKHNFNDSNQIAQFKYSLYLILWLPRDQGKIVTISNKFTNN